MGTGLFDGDALAAGYAAVRPAVHPLVTDLAFERLGLQGSVARAVDVGCGAGLSTRPLLGRVGSCVAVDPSPSMVRVARRLVPGANVVSGRAEALPIASASVDLVIAAGSLDFADLGRAAPELARTLVPGGTLVAYDFGTGARLRGDEAGELTAWLDGVLTRWPRPARTSTPPTASDLAAAGFVDAERIPFEAAVAMTRAEYLAYLATESFVTAAVRRGAAPEAVAAQLAAALPWPGDGEGDAVEVEVEVVFEGYLLTARQGRG